MNPTDIFKQHIKPVLQKGPPLCIHITFYVVPNGKKLYIIYYIYISKPRHATTAFHWAADHPRYIALVLLIWSLVPFIPCQVLYALFIQLPSQVIAEILNCAGYTPDQGVGTRPGAFSVFLNEIMCEIVNFFTIVIGRLALLFFKSPCGPGGRPVVGGGPSADLLPRLRSSIRPYGAVMDSRVEEGGEGCVSMSDDEEEEEENVCRQESCCQSRGNAIKCTKVLLKTLLFVSSVVVFVGSFKEGEGDP